MNAPADITQPALLASVFDALWVRAECCVDPLKPPDKSGTTTARLSNLTHNA
jgi:hypothetical protein